MSVRLKRETIEVGRLLRAAAQQTVTEAEAALPGGLRDEVRVFYTEAQAVPLGAEAVGNRVTVSGRVNFRALYAQGDLTHVHSAETSADFTRQLTLPAADNGAQYQPSCEITGVSSRVFNGRLLMRAEMNVYSEAFAAEEINVVSDVDETGAQALSETVTVQRTVGGGTAQGLVKGEFELAEALQAEEALLGSGEARVEDIIGGADGRATAIGSIDLTVYHASRMPGRPLVYTQHSLPFEQAVTLSGEAGDMLSASVEVTDVAVALEGSGEGQLLRAEVSLAARIDALKEQSVAVVSDVFGAADDQLIPSGERVSLRVASVNEQTAESGRLQLMLPEGTPRIKTILAAFVQPVLAGAKAQGGKLHADMLLRATLIYMTEDSGIPISYTAEEPARMAFAGEMEEGDSMELHASRVEASAVAGDRAEIRYVMALHARGGRYRQVFAVTDVAQEEAENSQAVLALYRTQGDERVWDVMKRYRLSLNGLQAFNEEIKDKKPADVLPAGANLIAYKR